APGARCWSTRPRCQHSGPRAGPAAGGGRSAVREHGVVDLSAVVAASDAVAASGARPAKVAVLAELIRRLEPTEIEPAVAWLTGAPRQGRIGVGWRTLVDLDVAPADAPSLALADLDATLDEVAACQGPGSAGRRVQLLTALLARATAAEQSFI